jgi:hypothetical protein
MKVLWTFVKVVLVLVLAIPVSIFVLTTAVGVLGALFGIAVLALRLAVFGLIGWGAYRLIKALVGGPAETPRPRELGAAPRPDPYYEAAIRELDRDMA